jgi:hypothetical protein
VPVALVTVNEDAIVSPSPDKLPGEVTFELLSPTSGNVDEVRFVADVVRFDALPVRDVIFEWATPFHVVALSVFSFVIQMLAALLPARSWTGTAKAGRTKAGRRKSGNVLEDNMMSDVLLVCHKGCGDDDDENDTNQVEGIFLSSLYIGK